MIIILIKHLFLIKPCSGCNINLTTDNRPDSMIFASLVKINSPIHITMICNSKGLHSKLFGFQNKLLNTAGTIQQGIFRMNMKMCKHITTLPYLI